MTTTTSPTRGGVRAHLGAQLDVAPPHELLRVHLGQVDRDLAVGLLAKPETMTCLAQDVGVPRHFADADLAQCCALCFVDEGEVSDRARQEGEGGRGRTRTSTSFCMLMARTRWLHAWISGWTAECHSPRSSAMARNESISFGSPESVVMRPPPRMKLLASLSRRRKSGDGIAPMSSSAGDKERVSARVEGRRGEVEDAHLKPARIVSYRSPSRSAHPA